jgi:dihydrodipicolinate reductase
LTVVLLQRFAETAARLIPQWEIVDYAHEDKADAPSGTARELAARLSKVREPKITAPYQKVVNERAWIQPPEAAPELVAPCAVEQLSGRTLPSDRDS